MLTYKEIEISSSKAKDNKIKCKYCGHILLFGKKDEKVLCNICNHYVFKDKQTEFKYRLKESQIKEEIRQEVAKW